MRRTVLMVGPFGPNCWTCSGELLTHSHLLRLRASLSFKPHSPIRKLFSGEAGLRISTGSCASAKLSTALWGQFSCGLSVRWGRPHGPLGALLYISYISSSGYQYWQPSRVGKSRHPTAPHKGKRNRIKLVCVGSKPPRPLLGTAWINLL